MASSSWAVNISVHLVVLDEGRIVEEGTHVPLFARGGDPGSRVVTFLARPTETRRLARDDDRNGASGRVPAAEAERPLSVSQETSPVREARARDADFSPF